MIPVKTMLNRSDVPTSSSLTPLKYNYAKKIYDYMTNCLWLPGVIPMSEDIRSYQNATTAERLAYDRTLAYLNAADVTAMGNVNLGIAAKLAAPEVQALYSHIAYQEANHSFSYLYMLQSLGFDHKEQDRINTMYHSSPPLFNKIDSTRKWTAELMTLPDEDMTDAQITTFLHGFFYFSQVFEGTQFMSGFNPIYSMTRRNLFKNSRDMLNYIRRDEQKAHVNAGAMSIKAILNEHPTVKLDPVVIHKMLNEAYALEIKYIEFIMPDGLPGYNQKNHLDQFKVFANRVCTKFDIAPVFEDEKTLSWLANETTTGLSNFFETTVVDYQIGTDVRSTFPA